MHPDGYILLSEGIFCSQTDVFCHQMDLSHQIFKYICTQSCIIFLRRLQPDWYILPLDGYMLPPDGYLLCLDGCPHHRFNFTFFYILNSCQQHPSSPIWGSSVQQALAMVAAEEAYSEVLQLEYEPREEEDE